LPVRRPAAETKILDPKRLALPAVIAVLLIGVSVLNSLGPAPSKPILPVSDWFSVALAVMSASFKGLTRPLSVGLTTVIGAARAVLLAVPWPAAILLTGAAGLAAGGRKLAGFCALAVAYIVVTGYWEKAVVSLSLVMISVPVSALLGLLLGILAFRSTLFWRALEPMLDLMQTIPTLAYLLPLLTLFGVGPLVAVMASALYATPPMARAVFLGLRRVPTDVIESGIMSGSTKDQLLFWVLLPVARPTVLLGLNQSIMASLSMVVIASMVAGVSDIGIEVYQNMKQAKFGESVLAGLVIALLAMTLDRISFAYSARRATQPRGHARLAGPAVVAAGALLLGLLALVIPALHTYPEAWVIFPADSIDSGLETLTLWIFPVTSAVKTWSIYYLLLPLQIGLPQSIRPAIWGFAMSPFVTIVYAILLALSCLVLVRVRASKAAVVLATFGVLYYFGLTGIPWSVVMALLVGLGYLAGGWHVGALTAGSMAFILITGGWTRAMVSIELTAVGGFIAFALGSAVGCWAALDDRVSRVFRPICDTLQTMPIFVFLIPAVMVFLVGEFTALVAIVLYSIAPAIRYTELGIRGVPTGVMEAARMIGATRRQALWQVQIPVALPEIALGLNQTIMMALSMVVVASLVGAPGLGQDVMTALGDGNAGGGLVAGLSIALIAIISDRMLKAWSARRKAALGEVA
jgi:glycine betaine/proline transport system permease protein